MAEKKQPQKQLERVPSRGMIAGVCAGFAEYFDVDVTLMRLIFVIAALATGGAGIIAYVALAIFMPLKAGEKAQTAEDIGKNVENLSEEISSGQRGSNVLNFFGIGLIALGLWILLSQLFPGWWFVRWEFVWPALLILFGIVILARSRR